MFENFKKAILRAAIPILGLLIVFGAIDDTYTRRAATSVRQHSETMSTLERENAKARASQAVQAHTISLERKRVREQELIAIAGSPADYAVKNADLNINEMLRQLAAACAPQDSRSAVKVDRFTEFELSVDFSRTPNVSTMGEITSCVLSRAATYVHGIRFTHLGKLVAELNSETLHSVSNWATITPAQASLFLKLQSTSTDSSVATQGMEKPDDSSDHPSSAKNAEPVPTDPVLTAYADRIKQQWEGVIQFVKSVLKASDLTPYSSAAMIQLKLVEMDKGLAEFKLRRDFLENPELQLAALLREGGSTPLYNKIVLRGERERLALQRPQLESKFNAILTLNAATTEFLKAMLQSWGDWKLSGDKVQIETRATQQSYEWWSGQINISAAELNAVLAK